MEKNNQNRLEMLNGTRSVNELKEMGYKLVNMPGFNRSVNLKHVKSLMNSVREKGFFLYPIKYIPAKDWFQFYPDRQITLEAGRVITKDSVEIDEILIILDGQHRYAANEEMGIDKEYQSTLMAEPVILPNGMNPDEWMTTVNSTSRIWNERDRARYINARNQGEVTNVSIAEQIQNDYNLGMRYIFVLLNFNDNYRKSAHLEYMRNPENGLPFVLKGTAENQKRGLETLHAIEVGFRNCPRVMKNMCVVEFVIEAYGEARDKDKVATVKNIQTYLMSLSPEIVEMVNEAGDKASRKKILRNGWKKFLKAMANADKQRELILNAQIAEEEWQKMMVAKGMGGKIK